MKILELAERIDGDVRAGHREPDYAPNAYINREEATALAAASDRLLYKEADMKF